MFNLFIIIPFCPLSGVGKEAKKSFLVIKKNIEEVMHCNVNAHLTIFFLGEITLVDVLNDLLVFFFHFVCVKCMTESNKMQALCEEPILILINNKSLNDT